MKLIIHDLESKLFENYYNTNDNNVVVISDDKSIANCIGCFGCWVKTPGACVIRDKYGDMGSLLSKCTEVIIISECYYGGFSPFIKNVFDRSISYVHPFFEKVNGEMHHKKRYDNKLEMKFYLYGDNITDKEKETAKAIIKGNMINLHSTCKSIEFLNNIIELEGCEL